jgi:hypothetical protein
VYNTRRKKFSIQYPQLQLCLKSGRMEVVILQPITSEHERGLVSDVLRSIHTKDIEATRRGDEQYIKRQKDQKKIDEYFFWIGDNGNLWFAQLHSGGLD